MSKEDSLIAIELLLGYVLAKVKNGLASPFLDDFVDERLKVRFESELLYGSSRRNVKCHNR